nr:MAG TPA: hypothetical protein [Caudoviricetes sp.]
MILWDQLEEIKEKSIENEQSLEIQLLINNLKITSFIEYNDFIYTMSLDILELNHHEYIIEDKTIENKQVKSQIRYIQVQVQLRKKREVND